MSLQARQEIVTEIRASAETAAGRTTSWLSKALRAGGRESMQVTALVFAAALFAIWLRPAGLLAEVWPANALLLAYFVRHPQAATLWN